MTSNFGLRIVLAASASLLVSARSTWAADKHDDIEHEEAIPVLIGDAVAEYDAGRFEEARSLFRRAHDRAPTARTLRGIGMASFELRDYVEATRTLSASLADQRRALTEDQRQQVQLLLSRAEAFVGRFTLRLSPASASVLVDGRAAQRETDGSLLLAFGRHRIVGRCATCAPSEKEVELEVVGGERKEIEIAMTLASEAAPSTSAPQGGAPVAIDKRDVTTSGDGKTAAWLGGTAVAAALGATASAIWWNNRQQALTQCRDAGADCKNESTVSGQRNLAVGMTIGLGAAAVATGIVAAVLWSRPEGTQSGPVACAIGKEMVSCAIRF